MGKSRAITAAVNVAQLAATCAFFPSPPLLLARRLPTASTAAASRTTAPNTIRDAVIPSIALTSGRSTGTAAHTHGLRYEDDETDRKPPSSADAHTHVCFDSSSSAMPPYGKCRSATPQLAVADGDVKEVLRPPEGLSRRPTASVASAACTSSRPLPRTVASASTADSEPQ